MVLALSAECVRVTGRENWHTHPSNFRANFKTSYLSRSDYSPECRRGGKARRATDVYRITKHIVREGFDAGIHDDTKIIAPKYPCDTERQCRKSHENLPSDEEYDRDERI